jgi:hypothetical protein
MIDVVMGAVAVTVVAVIVVFLGLAAINIALYFALRSSIPQAPATAEDRVRPVHSPAFARLRRHGATRCSSQARGQPRARET